MSILNNECEADQAVIESLLMTLAAYQKEEITMSIVLFKDEDGEVKRAQNFDTISRGEIEDRISELTDELAQWQSALNVYDQITNATDDTTTDVPTDVPADTPVEPTETPSEPVAPEVPVEPVAPVEPVVEAPVDPAAAPATPEQQPVDTSTTDVPAPTQLQ